MTDILQTVAAKALPSASEVLERLRALDRLMLITTGGGVTHERIGRLDKVTLNEGTIVCIGPDHDASITQSAIADMRIDRRRMNGDKAYPRVDFIDNSGRTIFSAVSFVGLEPFDAALEGFDIAPLDGDPFKFSLPDDEINPRDPGLTALEALAASNRPVTVTVEREAYRQNWKGVVENIVARNGFINIMVENFHFHLRAGTVAEWKQSVDDDHLTLVAVDDDGKQVGLKLCVEGTEPLIVAALAY
ncbi:hypothetical protein [Kaistia terrae]|uniref:Haemin-degrading HemS/ChuX domain-containing protein n=1 Tax=Kaistia terrae TaxID=537017 RepID=A0ABW0Q2J5_9HYPH|nr:hypothetical protein [Kaistia terrae]MCX5580483.1 hypothetical protein [Kaistia terrae]